MPTAFLILPAEVRLRIYDYALISRCASDPNPSLTDGDKKVIMLDGRMNGKASWSNTSISLALLQTCRTVYLEASSIPYAENTFVVEDPRNMITFVQEIGAINTRYLKSLRFWVRSGLVDAWNRPFHQLLQDAPVLPRPSPSDPWVKLFDHLAQNVPSLRKIVIVFIANRTFSTPLTMGERGLGDNVEFVRAFTKIQGLTALEIGGYYAQRWPAYLEKKMGVPVHARIGLSEKPSENDTQEFIQYQEGVRDSVP